jgi:hypothetical protein
VVEDMIARLKDIRKETVVTTVAVARKTIGDAVK